MHHAILRAITNYRIKLVSAREQMMVEEATRRARESAAAGNGSIVNPEMVGTDGRGVGAPGTAEGGPEDSAGQRPALNPKAAGAHEELSTHPQCICLPTLVPVCPCVSVSVGVSERALMAGLCRRASAAWGPPASGAGQQQQQQQHRHHDRRRRGGGEGGAASASASASAG
eukprot:COSAG01_NODE_20995_length_923_cov_1.269417_1_plen_170_part_10